MDMLTLKLPESLKNRLSAYARKKGISRSETVRIALTEYFSHNEVNAADSFFDLSSDLTGSVDGPPDLSTNKDRFNGYGT